MWLPLRIIIFIFMSLFLFGSDLTPLPMFCYQRRVVWADHSWDLENYCSAIARSSHSDFGKAWLWAERSELCPVQSVLHYFYAASLLLRRELIFLYCGLPFPHFCPLKMKERKKVKLGQEHKPSGKQKKKVGIFNLMRLTMERNFDLKQTWLTHAVGLMWFCQQKLTTRPQL